MLARRGDIPRRWSSTDIIAVECSLFPDGERAPSGVSAVVGAMSWR